jgi:hypothetical protein
VPFLLPKLKPKQKEKSRYPLQSFSFSSSNPEKKEKGFPLLSLTQRFCIFRNFRYKNNKPFLPLKRKKGFAFFQVKKNCILGKMKI